MLATIFLILFQGSSAHSENAILSKLGFGTSSYLGDIRPRGSVISSGGIADGVVPVIDTAIDVMTRISQGSYSLS